MSNFKFAIMGAGGIARKFCDAVKRVEGCRLAAVSSKSMDRALAFAWLNDLPAAYDSYEKMLIEEKPDCVYIAVTPNAHYELSMLCLDYKVPIICEKAMFMNSEQAEIVFRRAREQHVFVMEAMWSRFLPAVVRAKTWIEKGLIGTPAFLDAAIGFLAPKDDSNRYFSADLGGGVAHDLTVYAYELATYLVSQRIEELHVDAIFADTGVDVTNHVNISFSDMLASLKTSFVCSMDEQLVVYGDKGKIVLPHPHYAEEALLYNAHNELTMHYKDEETSNGFVYEIEEVIRCIRSGLIESPIVPHELTLQCAILFDRIMACRR